MTEVVLEVRNLISAQRQCLGSELPTFRNRSYQISYTDKFTALQLFLHLINPKRFSVPKESTTNPAIAL